MPEDYLALSFREFTKLKELADRAIAQLSADKFFAQPGAGDNSVAVIMKHVSGNMRSRWRDFLTTDGEKPDRNRDNEFLILATDTREELFARWEEAWAILFKELAPLTDTDLTRTVTIRGEPLTVLQAITRQLIHYGYHVGQIVYVARHLVGPGWKSLSIPVGQSEQFNRSPSKYIR
jgi:uncharacterized damage-inducible protein DinB